MTNPADTYAPTAMPAIRTSLEELARSVSVLAQHENQLHIYEQLAARAEVPLDPQSCWVLFRIADYPEMSLDTLAHNLHVPSDRFKNVAQKLVDSHYLEHVHDSTIPLQLTDLGQQATEKLIQSRVDALETLLEGWSPKQHAEVHAMIVRLARDLMNHGDAKPVFEP